MMEKGTWKELGSQSSFGEKTTEIFGMCIL